MGSRIHRAMGWGLPWDAFVAQQSLTRDASALNEELEARFTEAGDAGLTVPHTVVSALMKRERPFPPLILEPRLLAESFTEFGRRDAVIGRADKLYTIVSSGDHDTAILFYPNLTYRARWYRYDNDIDYAFERYRGTSEADAEARDITTWTPFGHHPWTNDRMLEDGSPVTWEPYEDLHAEPGRFPAVPSEIRWYLGALGILDEPGINALRPLLAQWWG